MKTTPIRMFMVRAGEATMGSLAACMALLGTQAVVSAGSWGTPFYLECSPEDALVVEELVGVKLIPI